MSWFNFLDKNCNDFGIVVEKYPSLFIPVKSFEKVNIAGNDKAEYRAGTYEPITLSIECYIKDRSPQKIREISKWLNSKSEGKGRKKARRICAIACRFIRQSAFNNYNRK